MNRFLSLRRLPAVLALLWAGTLPALAQLPVIRPPAAQVGVAYSYQLISGATPPAIYSASVLPPGLNLNRASGLISGVPTTVGVFSGEVTVVDALNLEAAATLVLTVTAPAGTPLITSAATRNGTVGQAFTFALTASNSPTSFNVGPLPPGLSANLLTGALSGTPTSPGTFPVAVSANNAGGTGNPATLTLTIAPAATAPVINSAGTATGSPGNPFTYTITASNAPTSFGASGLPLGLSFDAATGVISGTPQVSGLFQPVLTARNASGSSAAFPLALTLGSLPAITSAVTATGTTGSAITVTLTASNSPVSFNVGPLPAGLRADTTTGVISGTPSTAGVSTFEVSANNGAGTGPAKTFTLTVNAPAPAPAPGGGGGGGGGGISFPPNVTGPAIVAQPEGRTLEAGNPLTLSVSASGPGLNFQWFKDGIFIRGAQSATYVVPESSAGDAGSYTVLVTNGGGAITSAAAVVTVAPARAPVITQHPLPATAPSGGTATFSVAASGSATLTYQWRRDGVNVAGATLATLTLGEVSAGSAGAYSVVVGNRAGTATSNAAVLTVSAPGFAGTYFGSFAGGDGSFALHVRTDRSAALIGLTAGGIRPVVSTDLRVESDGRFSGSFPDLAASPVSRATLAGTISNAGVVSGAIGSGGPTFSAPAPSRSGELGALAGFYSAGEIGTAARQLAVVGPTGAAYLLTLGAGAPEGVTASLAADGRLEAGSGATATTGVLSPTRLSTRRGAASYLGGPVDGAPAREKLLNLSTRSVAGAGNDSLIAGFVVAGEARKSVLIRAVGPTLARDFGVAGALSGVRLEVVRDGRSVASSGAWFSRPDAAAIASAATRVGAFPLAAASEDAALLLDLEPGAYTAVVGSTSGANGVALIEVYDAAGDTAGRGQRKVNLSSRAAVGTGERVLIAGFFIGGDLPKRVLVRGIGPGLRAFGLTDALGRPNLTLYRGDTVVARNAGWSGTAATEIAAAGLQAGAFPLSSGSADAALILHLAPGAYTAQITGEGATTGAALVEVYEVN